MVHKFELIDLCCKSFFLRCFLVLVNNTAVYSFPVRNLKTVLSHPSHCPRPLSIRYSLSILPPFHSLSSPLFRLFCLCRKSDHIWLPSWSPCFKSHCCAPSSSCTFLPASKWEADHVSLPKNFFRDSSLLNRVRFKLLTQIYKALQYLSLPTYSASCSGNSSPCTQTLTLHTPSVLRVASTGHISHTLFPLLGVSSLLFPWGCLCGKPSFNNQVKYLPLLWRLFWISQVRCPFLLGSHIETSTTQFHYSLKWIKLMCIYLFPHLTLRWWILYFYVHTTPYMCIFQLHDPPLPSTDSQ